MDKHGILPILYDLAVTIGEQTSLRPLLTRTLQRFLYHTSFPAGFISLNHSRSEESANQIELQIDAAVGDFNLVNLVGQSVSVPSELMAVSPIDVNQQKEILAHFNQAKYRYHSFLFLPLSDTACIILLAPRKPDTKLPLNQMFKPILAHLDRAIVLCRRSDDHISQLKSDRDLFAEVFKSSSSGVMVTDTDGRIIAINHAFTVITGYAASEMLGNTPRKLSSGRHDQEFYRSIWQSIKEKGRWQGEIWNRRKNGETYAEWLNISLVRDAEERITHYVGIFSDLSADKEAELLRHRIAFRDPLTDLPNRRLLLDRLSQAMSLSEQTRRYGVVLSIGLDDLRIITDSKGHDIGNLVIKEVAKRISGYVQAGDTVSCIGGDEFVVAINPNDMHPANIATHAEYVAKQILQSLGQPYLIDSTTRVHSSASIGIALYVGQEIAVEDVLKRSDMAMTLAKQS